MISWLEGTIITTTPRFVVLNVGGVGYKVWIGTETFQKNTRLIGSTLTAWIHMVVREDAHDLYGFATRDELDFFELLITISGIGPKTAAGIMHVASVKTLRSAIIAKDITPLTNISGIGKKNAEKIVRELQDKLFAQEDDILPESVRTEDDVLAALKALGYSERDIRETMKNIPQELQTTNDRIKYVLKNISTK